MKRLAWVIGFGLVFALGLVLLGNYLLQQPRVQAFIIQGLADATGFTIQYDKLQFSLKAGIGFTMEGLKAQALQGPEKITAAKAIISLRTLDLLRKQIRPTRIYLYQSRLETVWPEQPLVEQAADKPLFKIPSLKWLSHLQTLSLKQSEILFSNRSFKLTQMELQARQRKANPLVLQVSSSGRLTTAQQEVPFKWTGTLSQNFRKEESPALDMTLEFKQFPLEWITWPEFLSLKSGQMNARFILRGRPDEQLNMGGQAQISSMDLAWVRQQRSKRFPFADWSMDFSAVIQGRSLKVSSLKMKLPETPLSIAFNLDFQDSRNPYLESHLSGSWMGLKTFMDLFPGPVLPGWYEKDLFPLFQAGQVQVAELNMKGHVGKGSPDRYPDTHDLILKLDCRDLEAQVAGAAYPFQAVNARVEIEKGALKIADFRARFGKSTLQHSGLESRTIFQENPSFAITLAGTFDLPELAQQLKIEMLQPQIPQQVGRIVEATSTGTLTCQADLQYSYGKPLQINQGQFDFQDCQMSLAEYYLPIQIKTASIKIAEQKEDYFQAVGAWGNSALEVQGGFEVSGQQGELKWLDLSGRADLNEIMPLLYPAAKDWRFKAPLPLQTNFKRNNKVWSCQGRLDLADFSGETRQLLFSPKPSRLMFDLDLAPGWLLDVKKIFFQPRDNRPETSQGPDQAVPGKDAWLFKGSYDLRHNQLVAWQMNMPALELESLGLRFKGEETVLKGELGCNLRFKAGPQNAANSMDGWAKGQRLDLHAKALPAPITDAQFFWRFAGPEMAIRLWQMRLGSSLVQINGGVMHSPIWKGELSLDVDALKPSDFKQSDASETQPWNWDQWLAKLDLNVHLQVAKGQWQELKWGPLKADLNLGKEGILIQKLILQGEHAKLETNGKVRFGEKPEMLFSGKIQMTDQPVREILPLLGIDPKYMSGKLNLDGIFYTRAKDRRGLIRGTTGFGDLRIKDAVMQHSSTLISILDFFSVKKVFKKRPPDVSKEGLYFEDIGTQLTMDRGVIKTDNLYLKGPVINILVPRGQVDLMAKTVDFHLLVQPLQVVDEIISHIPILGYILTGEDKTFFTYQFVMEGPWETAEPRYEPLKDLDQSVIGFIKRILLTPSRLLNNISNGSRKPSQTEPAPSKDD